MYETLHYFASGSIATIALNRPEVFNAVNEKLTYELQAALEQVAIDQEIRAVIFTGLGKAFCSGQDLKESTVLKNASLAEALHQRYNPLIRTMRDLPKPIICKLNGVAAGAGCSLVLACDVIIASEAASLSQLFINIGLVPDSGSSFFLPRLVGSLKAFELCALGTKISAHDALELGLVNQVVTAEALDKTVQQMAERYAAAPTKAIGLIKKMLQKSGSATLQEMLDYEAHCQELAGNTADFREGVAAFLEKREPRFTGN
ncbi:enoyl-CoA hydratase-related protein [Adhaeribacter pallidiroseus]|uniref:2-(1,2-epoxy-1,2-dihydrophenyl)acetyl-CoA isomerase n=1 Tax=Adhaeribacter pallidiroseus TaxID=2072847 RepID=A0A369QER3_9BACT|nr:enoyl-CoA hydratase-related protein [Adhaeribacter pallidiroseus]RDC62065.1 2-(1,2-epoxy-1,2-dihydrophenyl)acetyl-CoA isomerase [Adhaeribacter pallidiroseus]